MRGDGRMKIAGQVQSEWDDFIRYIKQFDPTSYLEVGARDGIACRYLVERTDSLERVVVADWPEQQWGRAGSENMLLENMSQLPQHTELILGNSQLDEVAEVVHGYGPYDVIFIDADHNYEGVKRDVELYAPMGKIVALHDVCHPHDSRAYGPTRLFNELDQIKLFQAEGSRKGIGVIKNDYEDN